MAEDQAEAVEEMEAEEEQEQAEGEDQKKDEGCEEKKPKGRCNPRIDELSKPRKWALLALWREYADSFEPERKENLRIRIQEEFCMSPEETQKYIELCKKPSNSKKIMLEKAKEKRKARAQAKIDAYCIFKKFLKKAMLYACTHVAPPLVSPLLRYMSESILVLLSEIHCLEVPTRCDKSNLGQFLIALSDWAAIFLAHIYYEIDRIEMDDIQKMKEMEMLATDVCDKEPEEEGGAEGGGAEEGEGSDEKECSDDGGDQTDETGAEADEGDEDFQQPE